MSLFEYLQSCSIEDFAEWLVNFQLQCEQNVVEQFVEGGIEVTAVNLSEQFLILSTIGYLQEPVGEEDDSE